MKRIHFFLLIAFVITLLSLTSCNIEGTCTLECECDYGVYSSTHTLELGDGYTRDECRETADEYDVSGCDCSGKWGRDND